MSNVRAVVNENKKHCIVIDLSDKNHKNRVLTIQESTNLEDNTKCNFSIHAQWAKGNHVTMIMDETDILDLSKALNSLISNLSIK